jgi:hypothetical protein
MPTTSMSGKSRTAALSTMRPMRPKPLMPTLIVMLLSCSLVRSLPASRRGDAPHRGGDALGGDAEMLE